MRKPFLIATLLAALALSTAAQAANDYYLVVPVKGKAAAAPALDIKLVLNSAALPDAYQDVPYEFDIKPLLVATGDPNFSLSGVSWSGAAGGQSTLAMRAEGTLSGTLAGRPMGFSVPVTAGYKGVTVSRTYFVRLMPLTVSLSPAVLPQARAGQGYKFSLAPFLSVSDPKFVATSDTFKLGQVPVAGISLSAASPGLLQTSVSVPAGVYTFPVTASYYGRSSTMDYTLTVQAPGYPASRFYAGMNTSTNVGLLTNEGPGAVTITDCKRTPAGGGTAVNCTAKDAWPMSWPEGIAMQAVVPADTYYISLDNGQKIVWQPNAKSVAMQ